MPEAPVIGSEKWTPAPLRRTYSESELTRSSKFYSKSPELGSLGTMPFEEYHERSRRLLQYPIYAINGGTDESFTNFLHTSPTELSQLQSKLKTNILDLISLDVLRRYQSSNFPRDTIANMSAAGILYAPITLDLDPTAANYPMFSRLLGMWRTENGDLQGHNNLVGSWWGMQNAATRCQHRHIFALKTEWNAAAGETVYQTRPGDTIMTSIVTPQIQSYHKEDERSRSYECFILFCGGALQFNFMRDISPTTKVPARFRVSPVKWASRPRTTEFAPLEKIFEIGMLFHKLRNMSGAPNSSDPLSFTWLQHHGERWLATFPLSHRRQLAEQLNVFFESVLESFQQPAPHHMCADIIFTLQYFQERHRRLIELLQISSTSKDADIYTSSPPSTLTTAAAGAQSIPSHSIGATGQFTSPHLRHFAATVRAGMPEIFAQKPGDAFYNIVIAACHKAIEDRLSGRAGPPSDV